MNRREFINAVQRRLGPTFAAPAEDSMRAVFQVLHARLDPGQAGHIETHLPKEFKDDWQLGPVTTMGRKAGLGPESLDRDEFLTEVQRKAELGSMGEAVHATRAVFAALQEILPEKDIEDTAQELPSALRGLWDSAPEQRPWEPRPEPAGHEYDERWLGSPNVPPPAPPESSEEQTR
jgi:uncharacterized protein (DUF2267 family)